MSPTEGRPVQKSDLQKMVCSLRKKKHQKRLFLIKHDSVGSSRHNTNFVVGKEFPVPWQFGRWLRQGTLRVITTPWKSFRNRPGHSTGEKKSILSRDNAKASDNALLPHQKEKSVLSRDNTNGWH